jgi:hypothetical protein
MLRFVFLAATLLIYYLSFSQQTKTIVVSLGKLTCKFRNDLRPDAEAAFRLMSKVYSSQEFQDSLRRLNFPDNSCTSCGGATINSGDAILNMLFSKTGETWDLVIKKKSGALGKTTPGNNYTTAFYYNITGDMCNLPFAIGLAVNLCHEYMHHICFCHPKNPDDSYWRKPSNGIKCDDELYDPVSYNSDVAYRVGWIAYDILLRWYKEGKLAGQF